MSARAVPHPSDAARLAIEAAQPEREFQLQVIDYARMRRWTVLFTHNSRHSPKGDLDLRMARYEPDGSARMVILELKTMDGAVTPEQRENVRLFGAVPGVTALVVRPSDWDIIERILT